LSQRVACAVTCVASSSTTAGSLPERMGFSLLGEGHARAVVTTGADKPDRTGLISVENEASEIQGLAPFQSTRCPA
jgi:hypothetical protein